MKRAPGRYEILLYLYVYLQLLTHLKSAYPVKSRIQDWVNEQLQAFEVSIDPDKQNF